MIAALFVEAGGVYTGLPDVDAWTVDRDARLYAGPHPHGYKRGDDGGCFAAALASVRAFGGVLEHPAGSYAWRHFKLHRPSRDGWVVADDVGGWTCEVEQGGYGNPLRKRTWLYARGIVLPSLAWGARGGKRWGIRFMSQRDRARGRSRAFDERLDMPDTTSSRRAWVAATPPAFRNVLLDMARTARARDAGAAAEGRQ